MKWVYFKKNLIVGSLLWYKQIKPFWDVLFLKKKSCLG